MGEDFDPLTTDTGVKPISHSGILIAMAAMIVAGSVAGFVFGGRFWGLGVMFGGVLSFVNYFWLARSTRAIFSPNAISSTGVLAGKYMLRYAALGAVLLLVYLTGALPMAAVIMGLAAFAFAVVLQGLRNIFASTF